MRLAPIAVASAVALGVSAVGAIVTHRIRLSMATGAATLNETLPIHSKWWRDTAKVRGEIRYVAIGDSAAQGIGASAPERSYVGVLAERIRRRSSRSVRVINLSVSGATVALAVNEQLPRFARLKPDIVTVAIGANDIGTFDPDAFEHGIREIVAALPAHAIIADLPYFYLPRNERKVAAANGILRRVAGEKQLTVVPLHETMRREGLRGILTQFAQDLFHPNDTGYRVWASAFEPAIDARLADPRLHARLKRRAARARQ